ncbi:MAG: ATP synthase F1 subunit delta [Saprospiraceae bacterium]|nr:ATP synthase F1 subunit delta [Saprospiraceae bacterium]
MLISKAARRYASALLEISKEREEVESILEDMKLINNTIRDSRDLELFLQSPIIRYDEKADGLKQVFGDRIQEITGQFIELLARKNRIRLLGQIVQAFVEQYNVFAGIIKVDVLTARALDDTQKKQLHEALEEKTGKKVEMQLEVNESLKGGMAVRIDDTVIDGTVKHKLEQLQEKFLSAPME